jgi:hypothetical protein
MLTRGCALIAVFFLALFAGYLAFFTQYFEWPGNVIAAGFGAVFGGLGISSLSNFYWVGRDLRAFGRAARREPPADGRLVAIAGPIRPLGAPLTSPFSGQPCVAYEYEVMKREKTQRGGTTSSADVAGFALAASTVDSPHGGVRLLGFPILDQFPQTNWGQEARKAAERYVAATTFESARGLRGVKLLSAFDEALSDDDGVVRKDFRLREGTIPFDKRQLQERVVKVGQEVCALGRYDAQKRALVPRGTMLNRLWPGTLTDVRREIVTTARSQMLLGLTFFVVSHAMLGAAFYMSETRHARESEGDQASAIRRALDDHDMAALELAVRRGASPNARDSFGDPPLLDVRDPAMVTALVRLGANVDVRDREDNDTALIRASRSGDAALVAALIAAHANVFAQNRQGATPLSEAIANGHDQVAALLRAAGASTDGVPLERPGPPK